MTTWPLHSGGGDSYQCIRSVLAAGSRKPIECFKGSSLLAQTKKHYGSWNQLMALTELQPSEPAHWPMGAVCCRARCRTTSEPRCLCPLLPRGHVARPRDILSGTSIVSPAPTARPGQPEGALTRAVYRSRPCGQSSCGLSGQGCQVKWRLALLLIARLASQEVLCERNITGGANTSSTFSALHGVELIPEWYSGDTGLGPGNQGPLPGGLGFWKAT